VRAERECQGDASVPRKEPLNRGTPELTVDEDAVYEHNRRPVPVFGDADTTVRQL